MPNTNALFYFKNLSYNHQEYNKKVPIKVTYNHQRYFGYLLNETSPYHIVLTQELHEGSAKQVSPLEITLEDLSNVQHFYYHPH